MSARDAGAVSLPGIFDESDELADELLEITAVPLFDDSLRIATSETARTLSLEHWESTRALLRRGFLPSAVVIHRAQFEALVRSVWAFYAASDDQLSRLGATLSSESEQGAKNMPQIAAMMDALSRKAPHAAYDPLAAFRDNSWKALNSYAHAGIHPIRRHGDGYPVQLVRDVLRNANGLATIACMQAAVLSGLPSMQRDILTIASSHPSCMPSIVTN